MKYVAALLIGCTPMIAGADTGYLAHSCEGADLVISQAPMSADEIAVLFPNLPAPQPGQILMEFQTPSSGPIWDWTDEGSEQLSGHCQTQYYMRTKPLDGLWNINVISIETTGCPPNIPLPHQAWANRNLEWPRLFTPRPFFAQSQMPFSFERLNQHHWIVTADPMPEMPGTVDMHYEFQVASPEQIDISGYVDVRISAGAMQVECRADITMQATHAG